MSAWGVSLVYDTTMLTYTRISNPLYTTVLTSQLVTNALNITGSGGSGAISGWFLAATLTFTVKSAAAGTTVGISMPAIATNAMTNSVPITYSNNFVGYFADSRGGWAFLQAQIIVSNPVVVGVYAASGKSTFVNTFALNAAASTDSVNVRATYSTGRAYAAYVDISVQPSVCLSANTAVITAVPQATGCAITLANSGGSSSVAITSYYNGFNATVAYRAFYFMSYSLNTTRFQLRRLGCDYETAFMSAFGTLTVDGVTPLSTIDISNIVTFSSSDTGVLSVRSRLAQGVSVGTATLSYGGGVASYNLSVISSVTSVMELVSYVYSGITVSPVSLTMSELTTQVVQIQPVLLLTSELQV
jgi:hypothetical protein